MGLGMGIRAHMWHVAVAGCKLTVGVVVQACMFPIIDTVGHYQCLDTHRDTHTYIYPGICIKHVSTQWQQIESIISNHGLTMRIDFKASMPHVRSIRRIR